MHTTQFLDEFRPFRRGELALARRVRAEPLFLPEPELVIPVRVELVHHKDLRAPIAHPE